MALVEGGTSNEKEKKKSEEGKNGRMKGWRE